MTTNDDINRIWDAINQLSRDVQKASMALAVHVTECAGYRRAVMGLLMILICLELGRYAPDALTILKAVIR